MPKQNPYKNPVIGEEKKEKKSKETKSQESEITKETGCREVSCCCPCCNFIGGGTEFKGVTSGSKKRIVECPDCGTALVDDREGLMVKGERLKKGKWEEYEADNLLKVAEYSQCVSAYIGKNRRLILNGNLPLKKYQETVLADMVNHCDPVSKIIAAGVDSKTIDGILKPAKDYAAADAILLKRKVKEDQRKK